MDHVAVLTPKYDLLNRILAGEKTIESRWTKNRVAPWDRIKVGETVYFKDSGKPVTAKAVVAKVLQFELAEHSAAEIIEKYGKQICIQNKDVDTWAKGKNYCVLIALEKPERIPSFKINRAGYGTGSAWLVVEKIADISI